MYCQVFASRISVQANLVCWVSLFVRIHYLKTIIIKDYSNLSRAYLNLWSFFGDILQVFANRNVLNKYELVIFDTYSVNIEIIGLVPKTLL